MSFNGLSTLEKVFKERVAPQTIKALIKYYGIDIDIYQVKNKVLTNTFKNNQSYTNKISSEVYQNNSLLQTDPYKYDPIDNNQTDYLNNLDKTGSKRALITTITFEQYNGLIAGGEEEYNMYCLDYEFDTNSIIQFKTKEGITKRYKIKEINSLGDTTNVLKRYIIISIVI